MAAAAAAQRPGSSSSSLLRFLRPGSVWGRSNSVMDVDGERRGVGATTPTQGLGGLGERSVSSMEMTPIEPVNLAEKAKRLPTAVQRLLGEVQQQESQTMIEFLEEARRSLWDTSDTLHEEQRALADTGRRLTESRLASASAPRGGAGGERARLGAQSARHRRRPGSGVARSDSLHAPVSARSVLLSTATPRGAGPTGDPGGLSASWNDSVTFESERAAGRTRGSIASQAGGMGGMAPSTSLDLGAVGGAVAYDSDQEYQEERDAIMKGMSGAESQTARERDRQAARLQDRKDKQKVQQTQREQTATELVREATVVDALKQKDRERQDQLVKERLEERKKKMEDRSTPMTPVDNT